MRDFRRALVEDSTALALAPENAELLADMGPAEAGLGRFEAARSHLEQAARLDPRSVFPAQYLGLVLLYLRQYQRLSRSSTML